MSRFTAVDAASVLTSYEEPAEDDDGLQAWSAVSPRDGDTVVDIRLTPLLQRDWGTEPDNKNAEHFRAVVVEGDEVPLILDAAQFETAVREVFSQYTEPLRLSAPMAMPHLAAMLSAVLGLAGEPLDTGTSVSQDGGADS